MSSDKFIFNRFAFLICAATIGALTFVPFVFLAVASVARDWRFPNVLPASFDLRAWHYLLRTDSGIAAAIASSFLIAAVVAAFAVAIAFPAARALALHQFAGKRLILFVLLLPVLSPSFAAATSGYAILLRCGLTDSYLGVGLAHLVPTVPYAVLLLASSFARFDVDYEAQARSLGANRFDVFRFVTFPALAPGAAVAWAFAFLISWSQYLPTLFVGGGQIQTLPLVLVGFGRASGDEALLAALNLTFVLPALIVFVLVARFLKD